MCQTGVAERHSVVAALTACPVGAREHWTVVVMGADDLFSYCCDLLFLDPTYFQTRKQMMLQSPIVCVIFTVGCFLPKTGYDLDAQARSVIDVAGTSMITLTEDLEALLTRCAALSGKVLQILSRLNGSDRQK
jgi:hypothetical protein